MSAKSGSQGRGSERVRVGAREAEAVRSTRLRWAVVAALALGPIVGGLLWWLAGSELLAMATFALANAGALMLLNLRRRTEGALEESARARQTQMRAIFETAPDGIVTVDASGQIHSANRAAGRIFKTSADELVGRHLRDLIPSIAAAEGRTGDKTTSILLTRGTEHRAQRANGTEFPLEANMGFLPSGFGEAGMVLVFRDVTKQKRVERQLRAARDQALQASEAKSQFLANMSHELRTPLNAVIGYSEILSEEIAHVGSTGDAIDVQQFERDIERIHGAGRHLLSLVQDILDLSKIESGQMQVRRQKFSVDKMLDEIELTVEPMASRNGNQLRVERAGDLGRMRSDQTKLRQILVNLLDNACKFTQNGAVGLRIRREQNADGPDTLVFEVADTGIGMSSEQLGLVFDAFTQADGSSTRQFDGTGLGLTIVRHFCDLLDGEVDVTSKPGKGTRFTVRLPAEA